MSRVAEPPSKIEKPAAPDQNVPDATVAVLYLMVTTEPAEIVGTAWPRRDSSFSLAFVRRPERPTVIAPTETSLTQTDSIWPGDNVVFSNSTSKERLVPDTLYSALPRPPTMVLNVALRSVPPSRERVVRLATEVREPVTRAVDAFRVELLPVEAVRDEALRRESSRDESVPRELSLAEPLLLLADRLLELPVELELLDALLELPLDVELLDPLLDSLFELELPDPLLVDPLFSFPSLWEPLCSEPSFSELSLFEPLCSAASFSPDSWAGIP